jgi:hypothetical protein
MSPAEFSFSFQHIAAQHSKRINVTMERLMLEHSYGSLGVSSKHAIRSEYRYSMLLSGACVVSWSSLLRRSIRTDRDDLICSPAKQRKCVHTYVYRCSTVVANQSKIIPHNEGQHSGLDDHNCRNSADEKFWR